MVIPFESFIPPIKRDGKLTPERWQLINALIASTNGLQHDKIIADFCGAWGISPDRLKSLIKAFRLHSPEMLQ